MTTASAAAERPLTPRQQLIKDARWYRFMCGTSGHISIEAVVDGLAKTDPRRKYYRGISENALEGLIKAVEQQ